VKYETLQYSRAACPRHDINQSVKLSKYTYSQITFPTSHWYNFSQVSKCINAISYNISLSIAVDKLPYICSLYYGTSCFVV